MGLVFRKKIKKLKFKTKENKSTKSSIEKNLETVKTSKLIDGNVYYIEQTADNDLIGFESYLETLKIAIDNGARFIGVISDYGTGKSTLLRQYEDKYCAEKNENNIVKDKMITINLWNCSENQEDDINIHKIFLYELIENLLIKNKKYYINKLNKNYGLLSLQNKLPKKRNVIHFIIGFAFIVQTFIFIPIIIYMLRDNTNLINIYLTSIKFIGFIFLFLILMYYIENYQPLLTFKPKDLDASKRTIDEMETRTLYNEIIDEYRNDIGENNQRLIICLEELDRYNNTNKVISYLKEFYKFYNSNKQENIIFILEIKSPSQMINLQPKGEKNLSSFQETYEKIFDFLIYLRPICVYDYDSLVLSMIENKQKYLDSNISLPSQNDMKCWHYLYLGSNVKIRNIKHRYNFAISLYYSVKEICNKIKTNEKINPSIDKCLFISYLEDEYNELYNDLLNKKDLLNDTLIYYTTHKTLDNFEFNKYGCNSLPENVDVLIEGMEKNYIEVDYNYYFYKFPTSKKPYDLYEYNLYRAIFYDEYNDELNKCVKNINQTQIKEILKKRKDKNIFPRVIFSNVVLYDYSIKFGRKAIKKSIEEYFCNQINIDEVKKVVSLTKKLPKDNQNYIKNLYIEIINEKIKNIGNSEFIDLRHKLTWIFGKKIINLFPNLFLESNIIIDEAEMNAIKDFSIIEKLINYNNVDEKCIKDAVYNIRKYYIKSNGKNVINFFEKIVDMNMITSEKYKGYLYSINFSRYNLTVSDYKKLLKISAEKLNLFYIPYFENFINNINYFDKYYNDFFLDNITNNNLSENYKSYNNIVVKFNKIYNNSIESFIDYFENYGIVFSFPSNLRIQFYEKKYYEYYIESTKKSLNYYDIEEEKFNNLKELYIRNFENAENWNIEIKEKMLDFLYENVDYDELNDNKILYFTNEIQTLKIINSIINNRSNTFINNYLLRIKQISKNDEVKVYKTIGKYICTNKINNNVIRHLRAITKNKECLYYIDKRHREKILLAI